MDPSLESTYRFIDRVVAISSRCIATPELLAEHPHGRRRGSNGVWAGSPAVQALMQAKGSPASMISGTCSMAVSPTS
jgi:hypothetical protein